MSGWEFWAVAALAAVMTGMGKGGLPVVGALVVPFMSLVISPVVAAGLMLPVYVLSDMFGLYAYRKEFNARVLAIAAIGMTAGVGLGWATASMDGSHKTIASCTIGNPGRTCLLANGELVSGQTYQFRVFARTASSIGQMTASFGYTVP